jgi:proteasome lid subunit RPN8/RPN11
MNIYISENAFMILTLSAVETSVTRECAGLLFGYKTPEKYFLELATPFQLANRKYDTIYINPMRKHKLYRMIDKYLKYQFIGEYHSHPEGVPSPSEDDVKYIFREEYPIEIIMSIREDKEFKPWTIKKNILSGSLSRYFIEMASFQLVGKDRHKRIKVLNIECPYALGFEAVKELNHPGKPGEKDSSGKI